MSKTIALTIGDPNGIGPEIAVKAAAELLGNDDIRVVLVGDEHVIRHYGKLCAPDRSFRHFGSGVSARDAIQLHPVDALAPAHFHPGQIDAAAGRATVAYVDVAIGLVRERAVDAIVGCPHNETAVNAAGIP